MRRRVPRAVTALTALAAAGLLLSGCHLHHRAHHGKPYHYAAPHQGHYHHHGKGKRHRHGPAPRHHSHRGYH